MSDHLALKIEHLSKAYPSYEQKSAQGYIALRDILVQRTKQLFKGNITPSPKKMFWALDDVSFEIKKGESIGIIGRNGAGKSTLLKLISRITQPTKGKITLNGRVASLLEVGTGFHPELTGRENIYLNGAIMGMKRYEIKAKFDEIVEFSGVQAFLDMPVKRFSSGMYMRLAFAVAAHLEPDILIVDEVLAVGDAEFQKKCLGKMDEVTHNEGRTVLFVSHNMGAIRSLCDTGILMQNGKLSTFDTIQKVIEAYNNTIFQPDKENDIVPDVSTFSNEYINLISVRTLGQNDENKNQFDTSEKIGIELCYEVKKNLYDVFPNFHIYTLEGICVFVSIHENNSLLTKQARKKSTLWIPANFLNAQKYKVTIALTEIVTMNVMINLIDIISFQVNEHNFDQRLHPYTGELPGILMPRLNWETKLI
ncbi:MAG: ABC transporter ATP-binding protein [Saprospiraceae bacterium]|nr:ABC transporter ATP-binding protein [Saprospiraceae bacterium]